MEQITIYSNGCPQCRCLKTMLENKNVVFTEVNDVDLMISKGFTSMPMLEVDETIMDYATALKWINK